MFSNKADNFSQEWKRDLEHIVLAGGAQRLRKYPRAARVLSDPPHVVLKSAISVRNLRTYDLAQRSGSVHGKALRKVWVCQYIT